MTRYFLIAGEASGDRHAAALIEQLKVCDKDAIFSGLGGELMAAAGCRLYRDYRDMAFMAFVEVVKNWRKIRDNFRIAKEALLSERPDVLVLVDYPSFNLKIAEWCKRFLPGTKIVYYIPPKVWAWKRWRVHRIARLCDEVLGIFPFEEDFYRGYGYKCEYVGNPTSEQMRRVLEKGDVERKRQIVLLPGSRRSEVSHCIGKMLDAARRIDGYRIVVTAAPGIEDAFYGRYLREGEQLTRETYRAVRESEAAVVNSGTATLETALLGCPQVSVYYLAASWLIGCVRWAQPLVFKIRYFTLVNILSGREAIRELVANDFKTDKIEEELRRILGDEVYKNNMLAEYEHIQSLLGTQASAETAAKRIVGLTSQR